MKLICQQKQLTTHLSLVSKAIPTKPTHPILANTKISASVETQTVKLEGFDLSMGISTSFDAQVISAGEIALPAKLLGDICNKLSEGEITIDDEEGEAIATLTSETGRYQVRGMETKEFPELPVIENGQLTNLPSHAIIEGLRGSLFATSPDEAKQILTGVHLIVKQNNIEFAATDGHRLSVVETSNQNSDESEKDEATNDEEFSVTVPARALRELERMVGMRSAVESVTLHLDRGQVVFELAEQRLTSRTLEGQYPNYRQLIPRQFERQITLDRRQLLNALDRIAVLADQKNNLVKCIVDSLNQQVSLSVETQEIGSGKESLKAQISGKDIEIAFNVKYLMDGLKALATQEIQIQLNSATNPVILTPVGGVKMTYLVMPVQIRT